MDDQVNKRDFPHLPPELDTLLSQLEKFNRPEDVPICVALIEHTLTLVSFANHPDRWALLQFLLGDTLRQNRQRDRLIHLVQAIGCYDNALYVCTHEAAPVNWAKIQKSKGYALCDLAALLRGVEQIETLQAAIACYDAALSVYTHGDAPADWAVVQRSKGIALRDLAELLMGTEQRAKLQSAICCFDNALSEFTCQVFPNDWALTQVNKSRALHDLTKLLGGAEQEKKLREVIADCDDTLNVYSHEKTPDIWSMIQSNKSVALHGLAGMLKGTERMEVIQEALACCDAALIEYRREVAPIKWALVQNNKGGILSELAKTLTGSAQLEVLRNVITCYNNALLERHREESPEDWASTQYNKGIALRDLAQLLTGTMRVEVLREAIDCCNNAQIVYTREVAPIAWAMMQNVRGIVLSDTAELLDGEERTVMLRAAINCYDSALLEQHREATPTSWAAVQNNKGISLRDLAKLLEGIERIETLQIAIECYDAALEERCRETAPIDWAMTQNNKGVALIDLVELLSGPERTEAIQNAIACFDDALIIYNREILPENHRSIAQPLGIRLFKEGSWAQAVRYLSTALDALEDLFTLEVTTRGRHATLKAGSEITAHLAYALVRAGGEDTDWQAAEVLERGRARVTGEAMARQEAQLAVAEQLTPDLLRAFREASDQIALISSTVNTVPETSAKLVDTVIATGLPMEAQISPESASRIALKTQLAGYEEAQKSRTTYNTLVARIRDILPDFLDRDETLKLAVRELAPDERLVYVASTQKGMIAVLVGKLNGNADVPIAKSWWDERLTHEDIGRLLIYFGGEDGETKEVNGGLIACQYGIGSIQTALDVVMHILGGANGVLANLAIYCRVARVRRLILVPCGLLSLLPLHAALVPAATASGELEPLLDVVQVNYAPNAHIWIACRRKLADASHEIPQALIVANPQPLPKEMYPLLGTEEEAQIISKIISQDAHGKFKVLKRRAATYKAVFNTFKAQMKFFTHIHLACHGIVEFTDPQSSGLLLSHGSRLMVRDLFDPTKVHFERLRLVALSACQTALPGMELPDEVVGLPSSWLQAGAMSVLASLWPVSDSKTVALMTKFYELHLLDRLDPTEALWLAQRWFRGLPTWRADCRAAGAAHAAEGPDVSEVRVVIHKTTDLTASDLSKITSADRTATVDKAEYYKDARYWAAFAIYGT